MAKFCKYCGKQLEDGEACSCGGASDTVKKQAKGIWNNFGEFVKNPVSAGTEFVQQRNIRNSLIIIGVYACLFAFFVVSILGKYNDFIKNVFMTHDSMMESSIYVQTNTLITSISFPLTTAFFVIAITVIAIRITFPMTLPTAFEQLYNAFQSGGFETFLNVAEDIF